MNLWLGLCWLQCFAQFTYAVVQFTAPLVGEALKSSTPVFIEWNHVNNQSGLPENTLYDLYLCAGGNEEGSYVWFTLAVLSLY